MISFIENLFIAITYAIYRIAFEIFWFLSVIILTAIVLTGIGVWWLFND